MRTDASSLPDDPAALQSLLLRERRERQSEREHHTQLVAGYEQTVQSQLRTIEQQQHELARLLRRLYGPQQERIDPDQLTLFDAQELEELAAERQQDAETGDEESTTSSRRCRGHGRRRLPDHLRREQVFYELSESDRSCPCCGQTRQEIGRDPDVGPILMDVDSPGGSVFGVHELSQKIFEARGKKPIVAIANSEAYSAGYYIASAADELWVTPTGMVGSIGVLSMHVDWSRWNEQQGLGVTYIHAGKYKVEGNADAPLDKESRAEMQRHVDRYYRMFVESVARNRGTSVDRVENEFGQGRIVGSLDAVRRGMVDKVGCFEEAVKDLSGMIWSRDRMAMRRRRVSMLSR